MEFKPGKPRQNYNVTEHSPVKEFAILFAGVSGIVFTAYLLLGFAVDIVVDKLPDEWAHASFNENWQGGQANLDWQDSKELQSMIDSLAQCAQITHPVKVSISKTDEVNAFALPNGQIVVFEGLLQAVKSENGLAFVLAHELAHFKNRDHLRQMGRGIIITSLMALLTGNSSGISEALTPAMMAGNANYSQEREMEADNRAMHILNCHYGHVGGATELFEYYKELPAGILRDSFLSSHPAPLARIVAIETTIRDNRWQTAETTRLVMDSPQSSQ